MRRRSHLAVTLVALLTVGASIVTTTPRGSALAADPQHQLAATQAQLADARAARESLQARLDQQRGRLAELQVQAGNLASALDLARAELADVSARYDQVGRSARPGARAGRRDETPPRPAQRADRRARRAAQEGRRGYRAPDAGAQHARGAAPGPPALGVRREPDLAARGSPVRELARRCHHPDELSADRLGAGQRAGGADSHHSRRARHPPQDPRRGPSRARPGTPRGRRAGECPASARGPAHEDGGPAGRPEGRGGREARGAGSRAERLAAGQGRRGGADRRGAGVPQPPRSGW